MKNVIKYFFFFIFITSGFAQVDRTILPKPGLAPEIKFGTAESFTLKNGLKVFVIQNKKLPRVTYSLIFDRDPILEGEKAGMLDLFGEMITAGTTNRSMDEFNEEVDFLGANISASSTSVSASTLVRNQDKVLELMTDVIFNPIFPEEELAKLKTQTKSGLKAAKNDPNSISSFLTSKLVFGTSHPYGELVTETSVDQVTVEDIKLYYETYFKPNIAYLAIVGDVNLADAKKMVNKYFSKWESGTVPSFEYETPQIPSKNIVALVDRAASQQSVIDVTYPLENSLASQDYLAGRLIGFVLGAGASSRLNMNIREDKSFSYGAFANIGADKLVARFSAGSSVRGSATDSAINEIIYEIRNMRDNGLTAEELVLAKSSISGSFARSLESPATIANFAINKERYNLPDDYYATYLQKINALTLEEVNAAAKRFLKPDNMYITVVGNGAEIAEGLLAFGEVSRFNGMGDPEKLIAMDANMTASQVIEKYIAAIGGKENAKALKTSKIESSAEIQGMKLNLSYIYDEGKQAFSNKVSVMGNVASNTSIMNGKGTITAGGQTAELTDEQFEAAKMNMYIIPELHWEELGYSIELDGIKDVEGANAFKIIVTNPTNTKQIHYYSVDSGLKVKTESAEAGDILYSDYQTIEGIQYPMMMVLKSPMLPVALESKVDKIEFNTAISEDEMK